MDDINNSEKKRDMDDINNSSAFKHSSVKKDITTQLREKRQRVSGASQHGSRVSASSG